MTDKKVNATASNPVYISLIASIAIHQGYQEGSKLQKSHGHPNGDVLLDAKVSCLSPKTPSYHAGRCACVFASSNSGFVPFSRMSFVMYSRILDAVHFQSP